MAILSKWDLLLLNLNHRYKFKDMKRNILFIILFVISSTFSFSQKRGYDKIDDTEFPKISFNYNIYSNQELEKSDFKLFEDNNNNEITDFNFSIVDNEASDYNKTILFLWEDMYSHEIFANKRTKYDFISKTINSFFENIQNGNKDFYNIATYNRDKNGKLLSLFSADFSSDIEVLIDEVNNHEQSKEVFITEPRACDLLKAVSDGLDLLIEEKNDVRALIVFTSGLNLDNAYGAKNDFSSIKEKSIKNEIPVYIICFPIAGTTIKVQELATGTYGKYISTIDYNESTAKLTNFIDDISETALGKTYNFSYNSNFPKDGKTHTIILNIGKEFVNIPVMISDPTFSDWYNANTILFYLLLITTIIIIAAIIVIIVVVSSKKKKAKKQAFDNLRKEQEAKSDAVRKENEEKLNSLKKNIEDEKNLAKKVERQKELSNIMKTKNLYPRLQIKYQDKTESYNITNVETQIGRTNDNDLVLSSTTISRKHAKIEFNGASFEITDLNSTNHVIVNGAFVERALLKNGDIIGLGEVVVYFYL